jgi:RNA polymerase sigma factor (sigma-70 family)
MKPMLDPHHVRQLCVRARQGSSEARAALIRLHRPLVVHIANAFYRPGNFCELDDLIQQGYLGILRAIEKFSANHRSRGQAIAFTTYAHFWICHFIRREIENHGRTVAVPVYRLKTAREQGQALPMDVSLDNGSSDGNDTALSDRLADRDESLERWAERRYAERFIQQSLEQLSDRKRYVIQYRFGIGVTEESLTQREIGSSIGVSGTQIGTWERSAIKQLRAICKQWEGDGRF